MAKEAYEVQDGRVIDFTLAADTNVGDVVPMGKICGVATVSGLAGDVIGVHTEGVYTVAATVVDAISVGDELFFDATTREVTTTSTGNARIGVAITAKSANSAGTVDVKLNVG